MDIIRLLLLQLEGDEKAAEKLKAYDESTVVYNAALIGKDEKGSGLSIDTMNARGRTTRHLRAE